MSNLTAVLVKPEEVETCINELFGEDNKVFRVTKDSQDQVNIVKMIRKAMNEDVSVMTAIVDDNNKFVAMYVGYKFPTLKGWIVGLTKVAGQHNHFKKSAEIMAPALDLLINEMEKDGYYKFWMTSPEQHHNIRNTIMKKYSRTLSRYQWFDEEVIKKGTHSPTRIFNAWGSTAIDWTDMVVRLFVLDQNERVNHLRKENHENYQGTLV